MNGNALNQYRAEVAVSLKGTVNDPQGITAAKSLKSIGFDGISSIRIGKLVEISFANDDSTSCSKPFYNSCIVWWLPSFKDP